MQNAKFLHLMKFNSEGLIIWGNDDVTWKVTRKRRSGAKKAVAFECNEYEVRLVRYFIITVWNEVSL